MHTRRLVALVAALVAVAVPAAAGTAPALPAYTPDANAPRSAVPDVYRWKLDPLIAGDAAFERARTALLADLPGLTAFSGRLGDPAALAACLARYFELHRRANALTLYASMEQSTRTSDDGAAALAGRSLAAMDELMRAASFIRADLLAMPAAAWQAALTREPRLAAYRAYVENLRRRSGRLLSPDAERALALLGDNLWAELDLNELPSAHEDTYSALLADIPFPKIRDEKGQEVQLTLSNYMVYRGSPDRNVRRAAVAALFGTLRQYQHALAGTLAGQAKLDVAFARARGYDTALEAYLDKDGLTPAVYDNLVTTVGAATPLLHRYVELRKKVLGLPDVHLYDLYIPLVPGVARDVPFAEARGTILEALKPLGPEYGAVLAEGLDPRNGWLDLYPHADKESGAYSSSVYGVHPYVFMNYQNTLDDMSTLAHEYGHALHSHLTMKARGPQDFRTSMLLAEIASTCNETLLSAHLEARAADRAERAYILVERLETIRTTIFRQTMFAELDRAVHGFAESGTPITATLLEATYRDLVRKYYGPSYTIDPDDGMEWAYIAHFYYKYYVWAYADGLSAGIAIADRVRREGDGAVKAYLGMLAAGSSEPPLPLLEKAGVDLTGPEPVQAAMREFAKTLDAVETLLAR